MKDTTLKEIATKLGISITTVSKALKNYPDVSAKTKQAVIDLAQNLHYTPNSFAVNLRTKESKTIGLIIPTLVHDFFSNVIQGILEEAEKRDYLVIILQSNEKFEFEKKQIDLLLNKRVDGILMSLSNETDEFEHLKTILSHNTPLVLFDKIAKLVNCSKVTINDRKAAYDAVSYLIKKGYKKIAHFRGSYLPQNSIDRFLGYKKALEDNNIAYDSSLVFVCENNPDFEDGYANAKKVVNEHPEIDAIFAVTDLVAVGIIKYCNEVGIAIPTQIAVLGFSNWFMSSVISPKLSTIDQPGFEIGRKSASILFDEINLKKNNLPVVFQSIELETSIIEREST
ncbi:LacI family DNA-binding transcriptional regulator [Flavobacterium gawalongense]|uniref:LacI family transcriptional regulator n=1 Tax=Flavobacterium gawalongense TaxID=2594432 RepID=A0A553BWY5_9FLAO|nr:LacI family DNA-binding transcriptional regulator [Flavobacterium gawalongense]TRX04204.1 LacI family transcriptional regulator [Flavobacterium gawalongense]TRX09346.1 LacI family transcriptional regulator [Flavobacterium gawalongense]TRX12840.1 LacI family transcriptional regulator [Flavobacterium gawalongense]TRX13185.1 LacI family transcriptional regulator [Flavobacterium gawalongense]TRX30753.1 LacI family transcriptional regulator [Flavobacterium gawalongense]